MLVVSMIGLWGYILAAILYSGLAVWLLRRAHQEQLNRPLVAAFSIMPLWALSHGFAGPNASLSLLTEGARNLAFLSCMYAMIRNAAVDERHRAVKIVYGAVAGVIGLQIIVAMVVFGLGQDMAANAVLLSTAYSFGLIIAAGLLVLLHNLYGQASPASRAELQLPVIALAAMWAYDLHLYTFAYLSGQSDNALFVLRGGIAALLFPLFTLASRKGVQWRVKLSRSATFQSLSLIAILIYLIVMISFTRAMERIDGGWAQIAQLGVIMGMTGLALLLVPSSKTHAWLRVVITKHFFEHRYDYRSDWLRFTRAVDSAGENETSLGERIVKALADMAGSPGGLLFLVDEHRKLTPALCWNWRHESESSGETSEALTDFLEHNAYVIDFSALDTNNPNAPDIRSHLPQWLYFSGHAWAGIPLMHNDRLAGLVILDHPMVRRQMDWEDYDLFRTAGIQAASYIAEAGSQQALADARRFDEFNRRFAFIIHDIKNLVSQLSLVARNAERHADNPAFREDMIATLQSSVKKMNHLLARLSRAHDIIEAQPLQPVYLQPIIAAVAKAKSQIHPVKVVTDKARLQAVADPMQLEQALTHLVQNAIDASTAGTPVTITVAGLGAEVAIEIADSGTGMSAEFIRTRLFHPFASTKEGGFGIGAFEAKALIAAMDGRIEVTSREGEGSRFTIFLPASVETDGDASSELVPRKQSNQKKRQKQQVCE